MTRDSFYNMSASNYNKLVAYFTRRGYEAADAEDYVGQWVVWGLEKEWKTDETHGFNDAVTRVRNFIRDNNANLMNANEIALGFDQDNDDDHTEACDYDFSHLFTETNERTQDEFDSLAGSLIGDRETETASKSMRERLSILTDRQLDAVYLVEQGMKQEEVASHLGMSQPAVCMLLQRTLDRLYGAYPELAPLGRAWTKDEIEAQHAETSRLVCLFEYEKPATHFCGFPHDKYEDDTRQCVTRAHCCTLHAHYTEPDTDTATKEERSHDAYMSAGCFTKVSRMDIDIIDPLCYAFEHGTGPVASLDTVSDADKYWAGATRLFNSLGLGRDISEETIAVLKSLGLDK